MDGTPANISIRMDAELKVQAGALFAELGMNRSTAFHIFVRQLGLPPGVPYPPDWLLIYRIEDDVFGANAGLYRNAGRRSKMCWS